MEVSQLARPLHEKPQLQAMAPLQKCAEQGILSTLRDAEQSVSGARRTCNVSPNFRQRV